MAVYNSVMKKKIVGREREEEILARIAKSPDAEFVAVYGRRRVGKTHLIREFFSRDYLYFEATGIKNAPLSKQLEKFTQALTAAFSQVPIRTPKSWDQAFEMLTTFIKIPLKGKKL